MFKTVDVGEPFSSTMHTKKKSVGGGHRSSRNAAITQESTLYSINNSIESPRRTGAMQTPMAHSIQVDSVQQASPRGVMRHATTPSGKGMPMSGQKFKKGSKRGGNNMKDMVFIYADMGQSKQNRQEAVAS